MPVSRGLRALIRGARNAPCRFGGGFAIPHSHSPLTVGRPLMFRTSKGDPVGRLLMFRINLSRNMVVSPRWLASSSRRPGTGSKPDALVKSVIFFGYPSYHLHSSSAKQTVSLEMRQCVSSRSLGDRPCAGVIPCNYAAACLTMLTVGPCYRRTLFGVADGQLVVERVRDARPHTPFPFSHPPSVPSWCEMSLRRLRP
jgi:hypothetical protein